MRAVLDACVLYPTVLREILIGVAGQGLFDPLWSDRILGEWVRATAKLGAAAQGIAGAEAALLAARWPGAGVPADPGYDAALSLPDPDDVHVLGTALRAGADVIVTDNLSDFPARVLARHGLRALDPDRFIVGFLDDHPKAVARVAEQVRAEAQRLSGQPVALRPLLKRAGLPRLGKALSTEAA